MRVDTNDAAHRIMYVMLDTPCKLVFNTVRQLNKPAQTA
jgi:hypothetical protein